MGEENPKKGAGSVRNAVATLAAVATLLGGGIVAPGALADDPTTSGTSTSQSATPNDQNSQNGSSDQPQQDQQSSTKDTASADGTTASKKTITSVDDPGIIRATKGDPVTLPDTVTVHYGDGSKTDAKVAWSGNGYQSGSDLAKLEAGDYTFTGTVDGTDKKATATVKLAEPAVKTDAATADADKTQSDKMAAPATDESTQDDSDASEPTIVTVEDSEAYDQPVGFAPDLPYGVTVTYSNGDTAYRQVTWPEKIDSSKAGDVTVEGTLEGTDIKAKAIIHFVGIKSIGKVSATVSPGQYPSLSGVDITLDNGSVVNKYPNWDTNKIDWSATKAGDVKTVTGTFDGSEKTVEATVKVLGVASVEAKKVVAYVDRTVDLPYQLDIKYSDGSEGTTSDIQWEDGAYNKQYDKAGDYEISGTANGVKFKLPVHVVAVTSIDPVKETTRVGVTPYLGTVTAHLSDGTTAYLYPTWDDSGVDYDTVGTYTFTGTLSETDLKVTATVTVAGATSVEPVELANVPVGFQPDLPGYVTVRYGEGDDAPTDSMPVTWDKVDSSKAGTVTVEGTVDGTDIKAKATVTFIAIKSIENPTLTTSAGKDPKLADNYGYVSYDLVNGVNTGAEVDWDQSGIDWSKTKAGDVVTVKGVFRNSTVGVTATVNVRGIKSIEEQNFYNQPAGIAPYLGDSTVVTYDNGDTSSVPVVWDEFDSSKAGDVTVEGTVDGTDLKAKAVIHFVAVKSIEQPETYVMPGTAPELPYSVTFTLANGETSDENVQWQRDETDWSKTKSGQDVKVTGTFERSELTVTATVHVRDAVSVEPVTADAYVNRDVTSLPSRVTVNLSGGGKTTEYVDWGTVKPYDKPGDYTVEGNVSGLDLKAKATIHVVKVDSFETAKVDTIKTMAPSLPYIVVAKLSDGTKANLHVTWAAVDAAQYAKTGSFTVEGTVDETDLKAKAEVTVRDFKALESVFVTTAVNVAPDMPYSVNITLDDGSVQSYGVQWDEIPASQYDHQGSFEVTGYVTDENGNKTGIAVKAKVQAWAIRSVENPVIYTVPGHAPVMPDGVSTELTDGSSLWRNVTWERIDPSQYQNQTSFEVKGDVESTDIFSVATVRVVAVASVDDVSVSTLVGRRASLPGSVYVTYADGRTGYRDVTWDSYDESKWDTLGSFVVNGKVDGTDLPVKVTATVAGLKRTEYTEWTIAGEAPSLSISAELTDGSTTWLNESDIAWDPIDPEQYAKDNEFDVKGKISNSDLVVTLHVTVASFKSVDPLAPVTTVTGVQPELPGHATVNFSDGGKGTYDINWQPIDPEQYAKPGTFTVTGNVVRFGKPITVAVTVQDSQKTKEVSVSTLTGFAPNLPYSVDTTLWDGSHETVAAQWETPDPASYAKTGSFDVKGYIRGSEFPIVAHVGVYDAADPVIKTVKTVVGSVPSLDVYDAKITLTNGDTYSFGYNDSIIWDTVDSAKYNTVGEFNVAGKFLGKSLVVYIHVIVSGFDSWVRGQQPYEVNTVVGSHSNLYLPSQLQAYTSTGDVVSVDVTWDSYDKTLLDKIGSFTVKGKTSGVASAIEVSATINVVDIKSVGALKAVTTIAGTAPALPSGGQVTYTNGETGYAAFAWNEVKPEQYAKAGSFTVNGTAADYNGGGTSHKISVKVNVVSDVESVEPTETWTVPGVAPSLPESVVVNYPKSLLRRMLTLFAAGGSAGSGMGSALADNQAYAAVTWNPIDPKSYAKDGTFTVEGTIAGSKKKAKATVTVASVAKQPQIPVVTTVPGVAPNLPYSVNVPMSDGQTRPIDVDWDTSGFSEDDYQTAGSTFYVNGSLFVSRYDNGSYATTKLMDVRVTVRVNGVKQVITSVQNGTKTEVGVPPQLLRSLPVKTSDGLIVNVPVTWDPIPPKNYRKPGKFTATGHIDAVSGGVATASLFSARSMDARVANNGGTVTTEVEVIAAQQEPQVSTVQYVTTTVLAGSGKLDAPQYATVYMTDGSQNGVEVAKWDDSKVDYSKPGSYTATATLKGTDRQLVYYINVAQTESVSFVDFAPMEQTIEVGTKTRQEVSDGLPQVATARYSDGSTKLVPVDWNLTPLTDEAVKTVGKIELETTAIAGFSKTAKITINVVKGQAVPQAPTENLTAETLEGIEPKLPQTVTIHYNDGSTKDSAIQWDDVALKDWADSDDWPDGVESKTFTVDGVTAIGSFPIKVVVTVKKAKKFTVSFDANGGALATGTASSALVHEGVALAKPADPTRAKYTFAGWTTDKAGENPVSWPYVPTGDTTLYAQWTLKPVPVTAVTISGDGVKDGKATVKKGETLTASAAVSPDDATNKSVTWKSNDTAVATVANGVITAVRGGKATITATAADGSGKSASIEVTVPATVTAIAAKASKTEYTKGDAFDPSSLTVTATLDDGTSRVLKSDEYTLSDTTLDTVGGKTVTVTFKANPAVTTTFSLTVAERYWTVAFDANGGSAVASQSVADDGASRVAKPADPTRDGFAFVGWTTDKDGSDVYGFDAPVSGDLTLYAQWKDAAKPVISGADDVYVVQGAKFDPLAGVSAKDNVDGKVEVAVSGDTVDTAAEVGTEFTLTYTATDAAGNTATATRKVTIVEKTVDVDESKTAISGEGVKGGKVTVKKGETLSVAASVAPANATHVRIAWSTSDKKVAAVEAGEGRTATVKALRGGKATITLKVYQANPVNLEPGKEKLVATKTIEITVPKTAESVKPLADLTVYAGHAPELPTTATVVYDDGSEEAGKTIAWDAEQFVDWPKAQIGFVAVLNGTVEGLPVSVTVTVVNDTEAPVLSGIDDRSIKVGDEFDPLAGVSAKDNVDGDVTANITVDGTVDTTKAGSYTLTYTVSDSYGNVTTAVRTITVTAEPVKPTPEPENPGKPSKPGEPENPSKPGEPTPEQPSEPGDKPTEPENPSKPGEPEQPENPAEPGKPEQPSEPNDKPTPEQPAKPGDNGQNGGSGTADGSGNQSGQSGQSGQNGQSGTADQNQASGQSGKQASDDKKTSLSKTGAASNVAALVALMLAVMGLALKIGGRRNRGRHQR
ncbi:Ig-like domain-containing protein [Bifidobacterium sp. SO1]|uniref:Ig-like domain-containing protein n=1 Tax=Bifidobacterium sp. SO1 TaxID=2809029 RepID=UPI0023E7AFE7|nr:Ig-like domain-containing protein [Bifidobacterium sp. SO1]